MDAKRIRCGVSGDLILELAQSLVGEGHRATETARSLCLDRPGDQAIGRSTDGSFVGRADKYPYLFRKKYLSEVIDVPGRTYTPLASHRAKWRGVMRTKPYASEDGTIQGRFFEFADEEYVQVEADPDGAVVLWSSDLPFTELADRVSHTFGSPSPKIDGYMVTGSEKATEQPSREVFKLALNQPNDVDYFVAAFGIVSVSWRRAQVKLIKGEHPHVECSLAGRHVDIGLLRDFVASTATVHVAEAVRLGKGPLLKALGDAAIS